MHRFSGRKLFLAGAALAVLAFAGAFPGRQVRGGSPFTMSVGTHGADIAGDDNRAIQTAIDRVAAQGGGVVHLQAGTYVIRDSIRMANHVTLEGEGASGTLLKRVAYARTKLTEDADSTDQKITVEDPKNFPSGTGILIFDNALFQGMYPNENSVSAAAGSTLSLVRRVGLDYMVDKSGQASNFFPVISGVGVKDTTIHDLAVDGNRSGKESEVELTRIGGGAIFYYNSQAMHIRSVVARNNAADGISLQFVADPVIQDSDVYRNGGLGIHVGTEALRAVVAGNHSHENGQDGLYLCWDVQHGTFEGNELRGNGRDGISIGHRDTDNTFTHNTIVGNAHAGVQFRDEPRNPGNRNVLRENRIENNGKVDAAGYGVRIDGQTEYITLSANTIGESRPIAGAHHVGIYIGPQADHITCEGNTITGNFKDLVLNESRQAHNQVASR